MAQPKATIALSLPPQFASIATASGWSFPRVGGASSSGFTVVSASRRNHHFDGSNVVVRILDKPKNSRKEHARYTAARHRNGTAMCMGNIAPTNEGRYLRRLVQKSKELEHVPKIRKSSLTLTDADSIEGNGEFNAPMKDTGDGCKQKALGFGYGKTYDISLEEMLAQQVELDDIAHAASTKNLKAKGRTCGKEKIKVSPPQGTRVWVGRLPKKKNVERDLRKNFRNVQGLLHIEPIEVGDEKTRHPLCKGFAFLTFASKDDASSFMAKWEGESCLFGKVEMRLRFQFAEVENAGESTDLTRRNAVVFSKQSQPSITTQNKIRISLPPAIETAIQSKR